jgi:hypothetical protein
MPPPGFEPRIPVTILRFYAFNAAVLRPSPCTEAYHLGNSTTICHCACHSPQHVASAGMTKGPRAVP